MSLIINAAFFLNTVLVCKNCMFQSVRTKLELGLVFKNKNKIVFYYILFQRTGPGIGFMVLLKLELRLYMFLNKSDWPEINQNLIDRGSSLDEGEPDQNWVWFSKLKLKKFLQTLKLRTRFTIPIMCGTRTYTKFCTSYSKLVLHQSKEPPNTGCFQYWSHVYRPAHGTYYRIPLKPVHQHYLYYFQKRWSFQNFFFFSEGRKMKESDGILENTYHLLKWNPQN